jgi:hypothetical protein
MTSVRIGATASALTATLGFAAGCWVVAVPADEWDGYGGCHRARFVRILCPSMGVDDDRNDYDNKKGDEQ